MSTGYKRTGTPVVSTPDDQSANISNDSRSAPPAGKAVMDPFRSPTRCSAKRPEPGRTDRHQPCAINGRNSGNGPANRRHSAS